MFRLNIKQNTEDLSICNIFWRLWCSNDLIHSYRCPILIPVWDPVLGKWVWAVNLDISKYLWWVFFDDLFIYFFVAVVVVAVVAFVVAEFHKGCNSVRLYDKAQDSIRMRAAVEKKPSTLEKDKEDQNIMQAI